jgi:hypothetical protein
MRCVFYFLFLFLFNYCFSQENGKQFTFSPVISLQNDFNTQDWYNGISFGIDERNYDWSVKLGITLRPFRKSSVIEDQESGVFRQYLERKFYIFLDLEKRFIHFPVGKSELQFYVGAKPGVLLGNYSGTKINAPPALTLAPMGGISLAVNETMQIRLGYLHVLDQLSNVTDGRITLGFTVLIL